LYKLGSRSDFFGFVAGRKLKPKIPGPVVFVAPYNFKPNNNCTFAPGYPCVGFEISPFSPGRGSWGTGTCAWFGLASTPDIPRKND
jgi:hypothetical protein